jgi:hypothetical protein
MNKLPDLKLKVGDIVSWNGVEGEVKRSMFGDFLLCVQVVFKINQNDSMYSFTKEGCLFPEQTTPCLEVVKRKKKTKVFKEWIHKEGSIDGILIDDNYRDVAGESWKGVFLQWTGREFEIEVNE